MGGGGWRVRDRENREGKRNANNTHISKMSATSHCIHVHELLLATVTCT